MLFPKKHQPIIIACLLVVISLVILSYSIRKPTSAGFFRKLVLETAAPLANMVNTSFRGLKDAWKRYIFLVGMEEENRRLKKENALLMQGVTDYREGYLEGIRLKKLLALKEMVNYTTITARVISRNQSSIVKTVLVDKGVSHGLRVDMPVINEQGVVGRIIETSPHVSKILLLIDASSNIDALVQETRVQGILQGASSSGCSLKYVSKTENIQAGNIVVSSGLSGIFPKGLLLGAVTNVDKSDSGLFQKLEVAPYVDFARLEEVMVIDLDKGEIK